MQRCTAKDTRCIVKDTKCKSALCKAKQGRILTAYWVNKKVGWTQFIFNNMFFKEGLQLKNLNVYFFIKTTYKRPCGEMVDTPVLGSGRNLKKIVHLLNLWTVKFFLVLCTQEEHVK